MKIRIAMMAVAALMWMPGAWAQGGSSVSAPAPAKVAVLNVQAAIANTQEGKQEAARLQSEFAPRQAELEQLSKDIDDIRTRLRNGATTLSDDEKARLAQEGDQKTRMLQRKQQDLQDDSQEEQRDIINQIGRKMIVVLDRYAKDNGIGVVLDSSSQSSTVVYATPSVDITQQVVRLYDQAYPVKTSGSTTPAGAAKPSTPQHRPGGQPQKP